jgi:hypothetical protein
MASLRSATPDFLAPPTIRDGCLIVVQNPFTAVPCQCSNPAVWCTPFDDKVHKTLGRLGDASGNELRPHFIYRSAAR